VDGLVFEGVENDLDLRVCLSNQKKVARLL
jgi:hypothetical protein